ncbi:hypothetical protein P22_0890 [Propionispora sp. 2/2-37]|uniref:mismatch-specific DNA-glycosylase n=1 Tax=Propionispora sp. 2/2-37 TaxID=1677858 RepID=UPI0006BB7ED8|nr:mismatch-specific DNA-glycosylase [Propionispora sp. 2/2-37]CUH94824.1 hypothetical protein P22_0890 [Propionispora sp. 2/2-37]
MYVKDVIAYNLSILFIGFNPGLKSGETGCHFAGPSNRFWRLLADSGLTPRKLAPAEDRLLLTWGYGITNIVSRPTRSAAEITRQEYATGRAELKLKLQTYKPQIACYVGIGVYRQFTGKSKIACGLQPEPAIPGMLDFVVSSPSGLNRIPVQTQLACFEELKSLMAGELNKG